MTTLVAHAPHTSQTVACYRVSSFGPDPTVFLFLARPDGTDAAAEGVSPHDGYLTSLGPMSEAAIRVSVAAGIDDGRWGLSEIDRSSMPGVYGFRIGRELRRPGPTYVYLELVGARPCYLRIDAVGFDPYDSFALELGTWVRANCHEHLTSGLRRSLPTTLRPLLGEWIEERREKGLG